ncbi:DUF4886 domain-containing protein [Dysgonomonas sp. Marseille-P4677]|uniref:DUF4886 domain-containing protein n=1 Tax=Dysgonomonas sp. Marseille-P4677 TaxID=2364790 RepID=UPI0019131B2C|nr:DUF4886 domain-containing protein [Dysgonomonas sp. Marseille-P4677]MBK5719831.1 DUF4886 domain-containing protein [Dysgonomonas sp. Marseille-P4677]
MKSRKLLNLFLGIFFISFLLSVGCSENDASKLEYFGNIRIDKEVVKLNVEDRINLKLSFVSQVINKEDIIWKSDNSEIAKISVNPDKSCIVEGVSAGQTMISVSVNNTSLKSECLVEVNEGKGIVRILAIGNSFSEDAVENYLYDLAKEDGKTLIIGNMYIGGCSLETHLENAKGNKSAYEYRKIDEDGIRTVDKNWNISKAVADENWDYISFQEVSQNSGIYSNFEASLPELVSYVKEKATNTNIKYILHQTWAYASNSTHSGFVNYENDQMKMYTAIIDAVSRAGNLVDIDIIIPAGTAIQNGRTSIVGDSFTRDGYHLDKGIGRFTAACTWYEKLFERDVTLNTYKPTGMTNFYTDIAKTAAHTAILKPEAITELTDFQTEGPNEFVLQKPIYINFNKTEISASYQSFTGGTTVGSRLMNIADMDGAETGINIELIARFTGTNDQGVEVSQIDWIPNLAAKYAFYGEADKHEGAFSISKLNPNQEYVFTFFGSRKAVTDNRETAYILKGATEETVYLNASSNDSNTVSTAPLKANSDGIITLKVTAGPNNNNSAKFYYLNVMRITPFE